jgi:glycosyltransferase involved in cell wall biosynthesis
MKILWLAPYPHPLDVQAHPVPWIGALADQLRRAPDLELTILHWTNKITTKTDDFKRDGIQYIYLQMPSVRADILTLYQWRIAIVRTWLRRHAAGYDLLHLHGSELQLPTMTAGLPQPQLLSVQGLVSQYQPFVPSWRSWLKVLWTLAGYYERRYLPSIHYFTCRTHWDQALVRQLSPGCTVYHNWEVIRPEFFCPPTLAAPATGRPQLVFVGGTQVMKGFRELLAAFDLIRQQVDAVLIITGVARPAEVWHAVRQADLQHIGSADIECRPLLTARELTQLYSESVALLHPSYVDNSPNSVCEAQVAGLPVVATDVGGVRSLVEDEVTGLLCTLAPGSIAAQALRLLCDPALRQRLATQATAVARTRHDPAVIVARTLEIYRLLLSP